jgi:hypothetical protein
MPTDVKAMLSGIALVVAAVLAYWDGSPVQPEYDRFVIATAVFMVIAMWVFPEAVGRKDPGRDGRPEPEA